MTNEQATNEESADDSRFEVKWRKKSEPAPAGPAATPSSASSSEDVEELRRLLDEERQRASTLQDRWQRAAADLVNLRKRTEQEQEEREKFASMVLVYELLPALDNFERALATIPGNLAMLTWIQGVMLIQRQLQAILEQRGLTPVQAEGVPFNPAMHEAIAERETAEVPAGTIVQEYQRGYTMHGRVIRPALVEVAAAPSAPQSVEPNIAPQSATAADPDVIVADPEAVGEDIEGGIEETETENVGP